MKKLLFFLLLTPLFLFVSCSDNDVSESNDKKVELVQLSEISIVLYDEQSCRVYPTVSPIDATDKELDWITSRPSVCTVEDGLITAVSPGVATVTAKTKTGKSASVRVEVKELSEVDAIHFTELELSLEVGDTHILDIVATPSSASTKFPITWSSSDKSVATVDRSGKIRARGVGACFIFADIDNRVRASCKVTVGENEADLSELVAVSVRDLPAVFVRRDIFGNIVTKVEVTSYEVNHELTEDGVLVTLLLNGKKLYDIEGSQAQNYVEVVMDLYMEDDTHCDTWNLRAGSVSEGEDVTFEFAFNAVLRPYQRQFYVILSESGSESAE